jgi:hypothetical protein
MTHKLLTFFLFALLLSGTGCARKAAHSEHSLAMEPVLIAGGGGDSLSAVASQRFIAQSDKFEVITSASSLEKSWE